MTITLGGSGSANKLRSDLASTASTALGDALIGVLAGGVPRTQHDKNADIVSVKDFGAKGDGSNDTEAINAALLSTGGDVTIFFPPGGPYNLASTITLPNVNVRIMATGATITRATNGNIFNRVHRGKFFEMEGATFTGKGVAFKYTAPEVVGLLPFNDQYLEYRIRKCTFLQDATTYAIDLYGSREGSFESCYFENNKGIYAVYAINTDVVECHFKNTVNCIVYDHDSQGLKVVGGTALGSINGGIFNYVFGIQLLGVMWDFIDAPVLIAGCDQVVISSSYFSGRTATAVILVTSYTLPSTTVHNTSDLHIVDCPGIICNYKTNSTALFIQNTTHFTVSGSTFLGWTNKGIDFVNSSYGIISGNTLYPEGGSTGNYGIYADASTFSLDINHNNTFKPIAATLGANFISSNMGWITENHGTATTGTGGNAYAFAHYLSQTPTLSMIQVTPISAVQAGLTWYVSSIDATNFVITTNVVITSAITFAFSVRIRA